jgi:hypothetical protein
MWPVFTGWASAPLRKDEGAERAQQNRIDLSRQLYRRYMATDATAQSGRRKAARLAAPRRIIGDPSPQESAVPARSTTSRSARWSAWAPRRWIRRRWTPSRPPSPGLDDRPRRAGRHGLRDLGRLDARGRHDWPQTKRLGVDALRWMRNPPAGELLRGRMTVMAKDPVGEGKGSSSPSTTCSTKPGGWSSAA